MDELVKVIDFAEKEDGSAQITLELNAEAIGRIKATQKFFKETKSIDSKIAEMMQVCICKFTRN